MSSHRHYYRGGYKVFVENSESEVGSKAIGLAIASLVLGIFSVVALGFDLFVAVSSFFLDSRIIAWVVLCSWYICCFVGLILGIVNLRKLYEKCEVMVSASVVGSMLLTTLATVIFGVSIGYIVNVLSESLGYIIGSLIVLLFLGIPFISSAVGAVFNIIGLKKHPGYEETAVKGIVFSMLGFGVIPIALGVVLSLVCGIVGLIIGIVSRVKRQSGEDMVKAGIGLSIMTLFVLFVVFLLNIIGMIQTW